MYNEAELVRIARRENNTKRTYLVVDPLQGKHVPVSPTKALNLFSDLADEVRNEYGKEALLVVGFAETATAIGAQVAVCLGAKYIQTTRETIPGVEYLFFSEEHSHATEQKLVRTDIDAVIGQIDRILFVEDEVTTGQTILNIISRIEGYYADEIRPDKIRSDKLRFSVLSLLNGMDGAHADRYAGKGIRLHYLCKTDHSRFAERAERYRGDGEYVTYDGRFACDSRLAYDGRFANDGRFACDSRLAYDGRFACDSGCVSRVEEMSVSGYMNARRLVEAPSYENACGELWERVKARLLKKEYQNLLVIGTEEFMYPALFIGEKLEREGKAVKCHATTRSPIVVSSEADYPLHQRYELKSLYDEKRKTFIYDLDCYDKVVIVTDAPAGESAGLFSLLRAVCRKNDDVLVVRWC